MRFLIALGIFIALAAQGYSQVRPLGDSGVMRVRLMHADPWAVKALLQGTPFNQPELSTILGFAGVPDKDSDLIQSLFGGKGRLVVNPTDNSLLFFPDKP
jgi:hypothetical protein